MLVEMRLVMLTVIALVGCGETRQVHRWPNHRREKDEQIEALQRDTVALQAHASTLEVRVHKLEAELAKLRQAAPPEPAPAALPSPGS
jgi:uncharacterized protein YlxW (UPF0749 family)